MKTPKTTSKWFEQGRIDGTHGRPYEAPTKTESAREYKRGYEDGERIAKQRKDRGE
jgi:hypothetical protein